MNSVRFDNRASEKIIALIRGISFFLACILFVLYNWDFTNGKIVKILPIYPEEWYFVFDKYTFGCLLGLIIYRFLLRKMVYYIAICIKIDAKIDFLPICKTIEQVSEIGIMIILTLKISGDLLCWVNSIDCMTTENVRVYILYWICVIYIFAKWLYDKNATWVYYNDISYTPFFDSEGNRIAEDSMVIYWGKMYKVIATRKKVKEMYGAEISKKEWYLTDLDSHILFLDELTLEGAVKDKEGNIKVYEWGMGEKRTF